MKKSIFAGLVALSLLVPMLVRGQLSVEGNFVHQDLEMFFLNDLDLTNPGSSPIIFYIRLENTSDENRYVIFSLTIESENYGLLAQGKTKPFLLGYHEAINLTNRDLGTAGSRFELEDYSIETGAQDLISAILATGTLPSDRYSFRLFLQDRDHPEVAAEHSLDVTITNPTSIELVSPGRPAGEGEFPVLFTTLPQFVWESTARNFEITVVEALPGQSPDEALVSNEPRLRQRITSAPTLLYPSSGPGVLALEEGKTYFWQVVAVVTTSSGEIRLPSPIYGFTIGSLSTSSSGEAGATILVIQMANALQQILPDNSLLQSLEDQGFTPTGVIFFQGRPITLAELQTLLEDIRSGKREVVSYVIEE